MSPRRPSPLGGRRPTREELPAFATDDPHGVDDVLPVLGPDGAPVPGQDPPWPVGVRLLVVGVNPGLWTAAVNAPFARPGNRFWPSLHRAGLMDHAVDASRGLLAQDEAQMARRGLGLTNLVGRATVRADELTREELRAGAQEVVQKVRRHRPQAVGVAGITAYRTAFQEPKAQLGEQETAAIPGWPQGVRLWALPQPSGLNAHETIDSLADKWRTVWEALEEDRRRAG